VLIGEIKNDKILSSLREDINPFNQVIIPEAYIPNITIS